MKIADVFTDARRIYIEAAPLIYYVEENPLYVEQMESVIDMIEEQNVQAISSVITLTEVLNLPLRIADIKLVKQYQDILIHSNKFVIYPVTVEIAWVAAQLRADYNLRTPDALHIATAIEADCDVVLTNDATLRRITQIKVVLLDDLDYSPLLK